MADETRRSLLYRDRARRAYRSQVKARYAEREDEAGAEPALLEEAARPGPAGMAMDLNAPDAGTRIRAITRLQRVQGNAFVQRVLAAPKPGSAAPRPLLAALPAPAVQPARKLVVQRKPKPAPQPEFYRDGADKLYAVADPATAIGVCDASGCYVTADGGPLATLVAAAVGELSLGTAKLPIVPVKKITLTSATGATPSAGMTGWRKRGRPQTVKLAFEGAAPRGSVLGAKGPLAPGSFPAALRPRLALGSRLSLKDGRFWTLAAGLGAGTTRWASQASVQLRTVQNSKVVVAASANGYTVNYRLTDGAKPWDIPIATYSYLSPIDPRKIPAHELPIWIEDFATLQAAQGVMRLVAKVRLRYNPNIVAVTLLPASLPSLVIELDVQATRVTAEQLLVEKAPIRAGSGIVNAPEDVRAHTGRSDTDIILSSVAGAEGGFASVEATDAGIFTWGQAQWTAGAIKLQPALKFIKERRADLWDKYWAGNGFELTDESPPRFIWQGTTFANTKAQQTQLFRGNAARKRKLIAMFAQAGMDPQIQRLEREFMRQVDVPDVLENKVQVKGKSPEDWLNVRGKAFFYSMFTNAEGPAIENFKLAAQHKGGSYSGAGDIPAAVRDDVSTELEDLFKQSSVKAWNDSSHHHYIAFWGTQGKAQATAHAQAQADALAADAKDAAGWTKAKWLEHKRGLEARQGRYQKTAADIDAALNRANVEPDVPPGVP